jgi:hypothetical protein
MRRALSLLPVGAAVIGLLASPAAGAGVQVRITKWEVNTVHNHKRTVLSGATITFCPNDPYYGISPFFTWSGVPFGAVMTLTTSLPRLKGSTSRAKTFEANGQNADTINASAYGVSAKSLPPGTYSLSVAVAGVATSRTVTLVAAAHC